MPKQIDTARCAARLLEVDDILLLCHRSPDGDCYGSAMALFDALTRLGKRARVECVSPFPPTLDYLVREMPNFSPRFVAAIDCASPSMLGDGEFRQRHVDLCIDHHPTNPFYADETLLAPYAAAGEAVYEVLLAMGVELTPYCATALYTAICSDTGSFRYSNTTTQSLRYAALLMEAGADRDIARVRLFEYRSPGMVRLEATVLSNVRYYSGGRIAVISVPFDLIEETQVDDDELGALAAVPIQIRNVDVGITLKDCGEGFIRVSVRTSDAADAAAICEHFHGGGHLRAAGCRLPCSLPEAEERLVAQALKQL